MSRVLRVSDQAIVDILEIWDYIAVDNPQAADQMADTLIDIYPLLLSMPGAERIREELRPGLRSYSVGSYVIFYRVSDSHVDILRVLHGRRNFQHLFEDGHTETFRKKDI